MVVLGVEHQVHDCDRGNFVLGVNNEIGRRLLGRDVMNTSAADGGSIRRSALERCPAVSHFIYFNSRSARVPISISTDHVAPSY